MNFSAMNDDELTKRIVNDLIAFEDELRWREIRVLRAPAGYRVFRGVWGHLIAQVVQLPDGTLQGSVLDCEVYAVAVLGKAGVKTLHDGVKKALGIEDVTPQPATE